MLAVRRNTSALPPGLPSRAADYTDTGALRGLAAGTDDTLVLTPTPAGRDVEGYRRGYLAPVESLLSALEDGPPRRIIYVSSTRVYGDAGGAWVDEETTLRPADGQAEVLCEAESLLLASEHRASVVRFSGIYGRLPSRLLERVRRGEIVRSTPLHYSNRIHFSDCVGFLQHLVDHPSPERLYLASDNEPAPSHEVERWLAEQLGVRNVVESVEPPKASRRCRNARMVASGYTLAVPDYRAGYSAMITSTSMEAPLGSAAT